MRKCAICPICKAKVYSPDPKIAPRKELTNHLHNQDNQTWDHSRLIARDSIVILEDDNGNEIKRDKGGSEDYRDFSGMEDKLAKLEDLPETVKVLDNRLSSLEDAASRRKDRHAGIPRNLWKYLRLKTTNWN